MTYGFLASSVLVVASEALFAYRDWAWVEVEKMHPRRRIRLPNPRPHFHQGWIPLQSPVNCLRWIDYESR